MAGEFSLIDLGWRLLCLPFGLMFLARLHKVNYNSPIIVSCRKATQPILRPLSWFLPTFLRLDIAALSLITGTNLAKLIYLQEQNFSLLTAIISFTGTIDYILGLFHGIIILGIIFLWLPSKGPLFPFTREIVRPYHFALMRSVKMKTNFAFKFSYPLTLLLLIIFLHFVDVGMFMLHQYIIAVL